MIPETAVNPPPHRRRLRRRPRAAELRPEQCHNCGFAAGEHNFCPSCGQENRTPKTGLIEITHDAWDEFVKIDSKLVQTLIALVCYPGKLTVDYIAGKRMRYISPFRLYLTVSFFFFLALSYFSTSILTASLGPEFLSQPVPEAVQALNHNGGHTKLNVGVTGIDGKFLPKTVTVYHTAQSQLPAAKRDPIWKRYLNERLIAIQKRSLGDVLSGLVTTISRMMFVLLPVYALVLTLLYVRRKRSYVEHFVYALHVNTAWFLLLLIYLVMPIHGEFIVLLIGFFVYKVIAMRRVYGQSILKSILKTFLLYQVYDAVFVIATLLAIAIALIV